MIQSWIKELPLNCFSIRLVFVALVAHVCLLTAFAQSSATRAASSDTTVDPVYFDAPNLKLIAPTLLAADKLSKNSIGGVITILFDDAMVSVQTAADPMIATWIGTIEVPIKPEGKIASAYRQVVKGSINKMKDSRVVLIFELGGKRFVTEFGYNVQHQGDFTRIYSSPVINPATRYTATLFVLVERRAVNGPVLVQIDSLDIEAKRPAKTRGRR